MSDSLSFGPEQARRPHLAKVTTDLGDLRGDVERMAKRLEGRGALWPELDYIDGAGPAAAGGDMVLIGRKLIQDQTFASLELFAGTSKLTFTALKPGAPGNDLTIEIQNTGALTVTKTANAIVITINLGVSTADAIATAVNANGADTDGVLRCASGGVGVAQAVTAATPLAGGAGEGWECTVGGFEALPANTPGTAGAAALTATSCTVTVPALAPIVATDKARVSVLSNGVRADLGAVAVE